MCIVLCHSNTGTPWRNLSAFTERILIRGLSKDKELQNQVRNAYAIMKRPDGSTYLITNYNEQVKS